MFATISPRGVQDLMRPRMSLMAQRWLSKIEDVFAGLNEIISDPLQEISLLPCVIDSQFSNRGIVSDISICPEVYKELPYNVHVGNKEE